MRSGKQSCKRTWSKAAICFVLVFLFSACGTAEENLSSNVNETVTQTENENSPETVKEMEENQMELTITINEQNIPIIWENNESVEALKKLAEEKPLTVELSMYGGFEQVGPLGESLPHDDVQTVTGPGDIVLYSGNQIVLFYGSNNWAYTRLGKIDGFSEQQLKELLGKEDVTITIQSANENE